MRLSETMLMAITIIALPAAASDPADPNGGSWVQNPYQQQNVHFDFYFDEPEKINSALYWIRSQMNPLMDDPYNQAPERGGDSWNRNRHRCKQKLWPI